MKVIAAILPAIPVNSPQDCFAKFRIIIRLPLSWENMVSIRLRNLLYAHVGGRQFF